MAKQQARVEEQPDVRAHLGLLVLHVLRECSVVTRARVDVGLAPTACDVLREAGCDAALEQVDAMFSHAWSAIRPASCRQLEVHATGIAQVALAVGGHGGRPAMRTRLLSTEKDGDEFASSSMTRLVLSLPDRVVSSDAEAFVAVMSVADGGALAAPAPSAVFSETCSNKLIRCLSANHDPGLISRVIGFFSSSGSRENPVAKAVSAIIRRQAPVPSLSSFCTWARWPLLLRAVGDAALVDEEAWAVLQRARACALELSRTIAAGALSVAHVDILRNSSHRSRLLQVLSACCDAQFDDHVDLLLCGLDCAQAWRTSYCRFRDVLRGLGDTVWRAVDWTPCPPLAGTAAIRDLVQLPSDAARRNAALRWYRAAAGGLRPFPLAWKQLELPSSLEGLLYTMDSLSASLHADLLRQHADRWQQEHARTGADRVVSVGDVMEELVLPSVREWVQLYNSVSSRTLTVGAAIATFRQRQSLAEIAGELRVMAQTCFAISRGFADAGDAQLRVAGDATPPQSAAFGDWLDSTARLLFNIRVLPTQRDVAQQLVATVAGCDVTLTGEDASRLQVLAKSESGGVDTVPLSGVTEDALAASAMLADVSGLAELLGALAASGAVLEFFRVLDSAEELANFVRVVEHDEIGDPVERNELLLDLQTLRGALGDLLALERPTRLRAVTGAIQAAHVANDKLHVLLRRTVRRLSLLERLRAGLKGTGGRARAAAEQILRFGQLQIASPSAARRHLAAACAAAGAVREPVAGTGDLAVPFVESVEWREQQREMGWRAAAGAAGSDAVADDWEDRQVDGSAVEEAAGVASQLLVAVWVPETGTAGVHMDRVRLRVIIGHLVGVAEAFARRLQSSRARSRARCRVRVLSRTCKPSGAPLELRVAAATTTRKLRSWRPPWPRTLRRSCALCLRSRMTAPARSSGWS